MRVENFRLRIAELSSRASMRKPDPVPSGTATQTWVAIGVGLWITLVGWIRRGPGLSTGGWHGDDAWIVVATSYADSLTEFVQLGFTHVGFNALARISHAILGPIWDQGSYQAVAFVFASIGLAATYWLLWLVSRSLLVAFAGVWLLLGSWLQFRYAVAVKPYSLEMATMALALLLVRFVSRRDSIPKSFLVVWLVSIFPLTLLSFRTAFVGAAVALGLTVAGTMRFRQLVIVGLGYVFISGPWLLYVQTLYLSDWLTDWWRTKESAFPNSPGDAVFGLPVRLTRVARVVYGGEGAWLWIAVGLGFLGAIVALRRRDALGSSAAMAFVLAIAGSTAQVVPFGPRRYDGERIDLWITPALLVLMAIGLRWLITTAKGPLGSLVGDRLATPSAPVVSRVAAAFTAVVIIAGSWQLASAPALRYPYMVTRSEVEFALAESSARSTPIVGAYETVYHLATWDSRTVNDVVPDPEHPRGIAIIYNPKYFAESNPQTIRKLDVSQSGVVVSHIAFRGPRLVRLVEALDAQGLQPAQSQVSKKFEVWESSPR